MIKECSTTLFVFGTIIAENYGNRSQWGIGLTRGKIAGQKVAPKHIKGRIGIVGIDQCTTNRDKITHLRRCSPT